MPIMDGTESSNKIRTFIDGSDRSVQALLCPNDIEQRSARSSSSYISKLSRRERTIIYAFSAESNKQAVAKFM